LNPSSIIDPTRLTRQPDKPVRQPILFMFEIFKKESHAFKIKIGGGQYFI